MYLRDVLASLIKRWYLTLAGLLVTAGMCGLALQLVQPTLESTASVVLLPPKSSVELGGNPYLQLGGLQPTLDLLVVALRDEETTRAIKAVSRTAEVEVKADTTNSGPLLIVTAHERTAEGSVAVRDEMVREVPIKLAALQQQLLISDRSRITSMVLVQDAVAKPVSKSQIRAVVVAAGAGLVGTALVVGLLDGFLDRRRKPRAASANHDGSDLPDEPGVDGWNWRPTEGAQSPQSPSVLQPARLP